jgi:hypothetical protein
MDEISSEISKEVLAHELGVTVPEVTKILQKMGREFKSSLISRVDADLVRSHALKQKEDVWLDEQVVSSPKQIGAGEEVGKFTIPQLQLELGLKSQSLNRLIRICEAAIGEKLKLDSSGRLLDFDENLIRTCHKRVRSRSNPKGESPEFFIAQIKIQQVKASAIASQNQTVIDAESEDDAAIDLINKVGSDLSLVDQKLDEAINAGIEAASDKWVEKFDSSRIIQRALIRTAQKYIDRASPEVGFFERVKFSIFPPSALQSAREIKGLLEGSVPGGVP